MTIPSPLFFLYVAVFAVLFQLAGSLRWRRMIMLVANCILLASFAGDFRSLLPLGVFVLLGFAAQRVLVARLFALPALITVTILAFAWLKHYTFIPPQLFLPFPYVAVGLSYIFFRVLHVLIDRYQNSLERPVGLLSYLNYVLNFPTLVSGPIQRYRDYEMTEQQPTPLDLILAGKALERILVGTFKVEVVSALLIFWQHQEMAVLPSESSWMALASGVKIIGLYPLYLYFNFSGYVDVVIGAASFFGMVLPENFDRPFLAENVLTFWNRWHMTLSGWLKTYVFNPLTLVGMSKVTAPGLIPYVSVGAFFVTFFLVGVWHGQTASFIIFGLLTGGGVASNKLWQVAMQRRLGRAGYRSLASNPIYRACSRGMNFSWFAFTLLWFWSTSADILSLYNDSGSTLVVGIWIVILALATAVLAILESLSNPMSDRGRWGAQLLRSRYFRTATVTALAFTTAVTFTLLQSAPPDIVYKAF